MRKTLFLNPPSYSGFDGGAGSRYQARREIRSFWDSVGNVAQRRQESVQSQQSCLREVSLRGAGMDQPDLKGYPATALSASSPTLASRRPAA